MPLMGSITNLVVKDVAVAVCIYVSLCACQGSIWICYSLSSTLLCNFICPFGNMRLNCSG